MKKSRIQAVIIGILALVIAVAGATYAWFATSLGIGGSSDGNAARVRLREPSPMSMEYFKFASALPGEEIKLTGSHLWYDGTRDAIIRIGFGDIEAGFGTEAVPGGSSGNTGDWEFEFGGSYVKDGVTYKYTEQRLSEILEIVLDKDHPLASRWHKGKRTGDWYIWAKWDEFDDDDDIYDLAGCFKIKFTGEFGGDFDNTGVSATHPAKNVVRDPATGLTVSRQWEQESIFDYIGLKAQAIQVTSEAIEDHWGTSPLLDVIDMDSVAGKGGFINALEEWKYIG